jgi:chloride channel 3/4/5
MELFKKMGPRVILVEQRGRIMGLLTVKDCLKYQFKVEAQENTTAGEPISGLASASAHTDNNNHERAPTMEEKIWAFIQRVGRGFWPARDLRITLDRPPPPSGHAREEEYGILDGTEDDNFVELEDRAR